MRRSLKRLNAVLWWNQNKRTMSDENTCNKANSPPRETENVEATPPKPVQANPPIHRSSSPLEPRVLQPVQEARPLER